MKIHAGGKTKFLLYGSQNARKNFVAYADKFKI